MYTPQINTNENTQCLPRPPSASLIACDGSNRAGGTTSRKEPCCQLSQGGSTTRRTKMDTRTLWPASALQRDLPPPATTGTLLGTPRGPAGQAPRAPLPPADVRLAPGHGDNSYHGKAAGPGHRMKLDLDPERLSNSVSA